MKSFIFSFLVYGSALASNSAEARQTNFKTVKTASGFVAGHASSNASAGVSEYLGIPYAKPPVGNLRFAPPELFEGTSIINGTSFGFSCEAYSSAQQPSPGTISQANLTAAGLAILTGLSQATDKFSEDCLTLNIWVPSDGETKKAVLLWIYGGSFNTGATDIPTYNGQNIASQEDVIVVSINYRLTIFGFPGNPSIPDLNFGLLDQRLAIEWVYENIAAFGGDPSRITLFGQSSGSDSIDLYSYAYASNPIIAGMIQESGSSQDERFVDTSTANAAWFNVTSTLSCGNSTSNATDVLTCMRTKTTSEIMDALPQPNAQSLNLGPFSPAIDNITIFSDYPARSTAGNFAKIPLLIGNTDYEAGLFVTVLAVLYNETLSAQNATDLDLYEFTCPAAARANLSSAAGLPTWRYRWFGDFPNLQLTTTELSGAWHSSELPVLFANPPSGTDVPNNTAAELSIGGYIRGAWAAFAKDPASGLSSYQGGWPKYSPSDNTLVRLAYNNLTGTNLAMPGLYDGPCNIASGATSTSSTSSATSTSGTSSATSTLLQTSGGIRLSPSGIGLYSIFSITMCLLVLDWRVSPIVE